MIFSPKTMETSRMGDVFCSRTDSDVPWTSPCLLDTVWFQEESEPLIPVQNRKGFFVWLGFFFMFSFGFLGGCVLIFFLNSVYAHHTVLPLNKAFWRRCEIHILCTKHAQNALKLWGGFDPRHGGIVTALNPLEVGPCRQRGFQSVNKRI